METFGISFEDILWKYSFLNLQLLMEDKIRYVGSKGKSENGKDDDYFPPIMTEKEETDFFKSLKKR